MQKWAGMCEVPIAQLYKHMISQDESILPFEINNREEGLYLMWKLLTHPETYTRTIGIILAMCIGIYCLRSFWIRPVTPGH